MKTSIFPKKFGGDMNRHYEILKNELKDVHGKRVLELATGSGSAINFLPNDNGYTGTDISPGLLKIAVNLFEKSGFKNAEFYVASADRLPLSDGSFDVILCILSLNFFDDTKAVFKEIQRVAATDAVFICCVPVPERKRPETKIRGILHSAAELEKMCRENGFDFESMAVENGGLLYFRSILRSSRKV